MPVRSDHDQVDLALGGEPQDAEKRRVDADFDAKGRPLPVRLEPLAHVRFHLLAVLVDPRGLHRQDRKLRHRVDGRQEVRDQQASARGARQVCRHAQRRIRRLAVVDRDQDVRERRHGRSSWRRPEPLSYQSRRAATAATALIPPTVSESAGSSNSTRTTPASQRQRVGVPRSAKKTEHARFAAQHLHREAAVARGHGGPHQDPHDVAA